MRPNNIETLRFAATLLLVSYHAIGSAPGAGMGLEYPHPLRVYADAFSSLRMPLFAFIAGCVYAVKPIAAGQAGSFVTGKIRRLIVPGIVAAVTFWTLKTLILPEEMSEPRALFGALSLTYAHFWFLQAIFVILICQGALDLATGRGGLWIGLVAAAILFVAQPSLHSPYVATIGMSYLYPFFLFGMLVHRWREPLMRHARPVMGLAGICTALCLAWGIAGFLATGIVPQDARHGASVGLALGVILVAYLTVPASAALTRFGAFGFTIYLYHPIATSGMRRLAEGAGVDSDLALFLASSAAGLAGPVALHMALSRWTPTARVVLGLRQATASYPAIMRRPAPTAPPGALPG